ncbi:MAG: hypothetical protein CMJ58_19545 [Planctomycetaceae bacterium]|nr:hypothetical protein [Planctomycetaceae bacterium]
MDAFTPNLDACRGRQQRLLAEMQKQGWKRVIATRGETVQWLSGVYLGPLWSPCAALDADGRLTLALPNRKRDTPAAADEVVGYEAKWHSTFRNDQPAASAAALTAALAPPTGLVAVEWSQWRTYLQAAAGESPADVESTLFSLRRHKDPDELRMMQRANDANRAMFARARDVVEPGLTELDLYNELHAAAVRILGEPLTYFGQDFRANARGGAPRDRAAQAGELWILDLGVGFRGYFSDNARTLAVGGDPTPAQQDAWRRLADVFPLVESTVKPGVSCRELHEQVQAMLDDAAPWAFNHHLGHGVGLAPHEGPHLNPQWDETFAVGDFFTVEPGLYHDELRHGIRLEQNYVVTDSGVQLLTDWPLELV